VYLFGAGATHAELLNRNPELIVEKYGLLIGNVSSRVIEKARASTRYIKNVAMVSGTAGSLNIELLISLIENSKIQGWEYKTRRLKNLVQADIENILSGSRTRGFYLHKALLELHQHPLTKAAEQLTGLISLNYDDILDQAYQLYLGDPIYCFTLEDTPSEDKVPLLKLHGSFNWKSKKIRGRRRTIEIIPLGTAKNYLHAPYGFIWNRALEVLIECDTLRVIGCSLSPNDSHFIDLMFKAHLEGGRAFDIEIINHEKAGEDIKGNYGFFPGIRTFSKIEGTLIPEGSSANPFKTWLKYKGLAMLGQDAINTTRDMKKVVR